jgi:hypothetical protein
MNYFQALKEWNKKHNKGIYCSPKKGTKEHEEVLALQKKAIENGSPIPPRKPRTKKEKIEKSPNINPPAPVSVSVPRSSLKSPSATAVKIRKDRKTGSSVKLAVPKSTNVPDDDYEDMTTGMKMKKRKVKIAVPVADRPLPTTSFSKRKSNTPTTQFSSRHGNSNMPLTQFSSRGGGGASIISQSVPTISFSTQTDLPQSEEKPKMMDSSIQTDKNYRGAGRPAGAKNKDKAPKLPKLTSSFVYDDEGEAKKILYGAIKGKLARNKMKRAEKQRTFDILLNS